MGKPGPIWVVRAGEDSAYIDEFLSDGVAAIGWSEAGPIDATTSDEEVRQKFLSAYPEGKERSRSVGAAMVKRFAREVQPGDLITTYDRNRRLYPLGTVAGELQWRQHYLARVRKVKWTHEVDRDALSVSARNSLGAIATMFRLGAEVAAEMLATARPIGDAAAAVPAPPHRPDDEGLTQDSLLQDVEERARQFVEDRLARLDWDEMQELVAGILRAMGYKTRVSPPGPDRGVDIFASPDGLGLQEPRIFVEVKHREAQMGVQEIRAFLGGRKPGDRCLYVSTGGFTKDARLEAERASVPLTLLTMRDLQQLLLQHYDRVDAETQALLPLRKIYWPARTAEE